MKLTIIFSLICSIALGQSMFLAPSKASAYQNTVKGTSPLAYWPLNDEGTLVEASPRTYDGSNAARQLHKNFLDGKAVIYKSAGSNIYTSSLNSNMNKAEGSIMIWFKMIRKSEWTPSAVQRLLYIAADLNNRFIIQLSTDSKIQCLRIAAGNAVTAEYSFSSTKPLNWQCIIMTYSVSNNQLKMFVNGVQQGGTQTGLSTFSGSLSSTQVCVGAQDTGNQFALTYVCAAHLAIWTSVISAPTITTLSTLPEYKPTRLQHSIQASWDIFSLFGITGSTMACFAYDVNGDGDKDFVGNIGRRARFVAVEQDGTILWDNTVDNSQVEGLRFPQVRNGILYFGWTNHAVAINMTTGATVWNKTPMASPPGSGLGGMNQSSAGLVMGVGNKLDILNYATGNSIGGNFPITLPFDQWEQSLSVGTFGTSTEVIIANDNFNNMICFNIDGTIRFQKGPLVSIPWVNENDWYEFFDYQNSGSKVLGLVGDDDGNSTQPAGEGDEFHIYSNSGTQLDKYDDGIHTGGLEIHSYAFPNTGRVVFTHESDYTNRAITMLDHNLNAVWSKDVGIPYEGDQIILIDIDTDGIPEILYSTEVFSQTSGFRVLNYDGRPKYFYTEDSPNEPTDLVDDRGAAVNINVSRAPYYWNPDEFIQFTLRTTDNTGHEKIYLHKWTVTP